MARGISSTKNREILSTSGMRSTSQRSLILNIIRQGEGHLDADEVYRRARQQQPRLSLSTVYRTLLKLKQLGLVEERHFDESRHHYELKPPTEHHHLVCLGCGKIVEFECSISEKIKKQISREKGFQVTGTEVQMTGYCPDCRKNHK
ncbi:Fur family transcriptional regulator [Chloroflexota bacterium]